MSVGNRVFLHRKLPELAMLAAFSQIPAANIADTMERSCAMNPRVRLFSRPAAPIVAGPALTVRTRAGDNIMIHQALDMACEGDILVVSNEGDGSRALMGEIMFAYAQHKKIAAIVLDGPIRDVDAVSKMSLPVYATGTTPGGPYKEGPGEINVPVACGEISVCPGDIVVADADGVIAIPLRDAGVVLEAAKKLSELDAAKVKAAADGTAKREWVAKTLEAKGVKFIDAGYF